VKNTGSESLKLEKKMLGLDGLENLANQSKKKDKLIEENSIKLDKIVKTKQLIEMEEIIK